MKIRLQYFKICSLLILLTAFLMPVRSAMTLSANGMRVEKSKTQEGGRLAFAGFQQVAQSYPPDPTAGIPWSGGMTGVADIQAAFNHARMTENSQVGISLPMLTMPSQAEWNGMNDGERALWLINNERIDRGIAPLHGLESNVTSVAQYYANYLLQHNAWGHEADGRSPWARLDANPAIGACSDFLSVAENISVFVTTGSNIPLPVEQAVYAWVYDDDCCGWGHRHAILWYPYNDNSGLIGREGFLGIGRAHGGPYQGPFSQPWPFAEMIVMNVFDPCSTWVYAGINNMQVNIAGATQAVYSLAKGANLRVAYSGLNNGPVQIKNTDGTPFVASERVAYSPDGGTTWTSHSELMGLPVNQLTSSYTFPWYNNLDLNSQLRFGNVGNASTVVTVTIGGVVRGTYTLTPNASTRISYAALDAGPVKVTSSGNVPIIASMRVAYFDGSAWTSFSEIMGMPSPKLTNSYVFPWYNNIDLNSQLRFGNVGLAPTTVTVTVGGVFKGSYQLAVNESKRVSYAGLDKGPVKVTSSGNVPIITSIRVAYFNGSAWTDFSEMMGLPSNQLGTHYSFPVYNNASLNTQLRFGNVGSANTTVTIKIGGVLKGNYNLAPNASQRVSYVGLDGGPVVLQSSGGVPIIASERVAYFNGSAWTSFAEMMGLPQSQLSTTYLFPWYNNLDLNSQLRFGVP